MSSRTRARLPGYPTRKSPKKDKKEPFKSSAFIYKVDDSFLIRLQPFQDKIRTPFRYHYGRCLQVRRGDLWEDACIANPQAIDPMHAQLVVDDPWGVGIIRRCHATARGVVVDRSDPAANELVKFFGAAFFDVLFLFVLGEGDIPQEGEAGSFHLLAEFQREANGCPGDGIVRWIGEYPEVDLGSVMRVG